MPKPPRQQANGFFGWGMGIPDPWAQNQGKEEEAPTGNEETEEYQGWSEEQLNSMIAALKGKKGGKAKGKGGQKGN